MENYIYLDLIVMLRGLTQFHPIKHGWSLSDM